MATPIVGTNVKVEIESTLGSALPVTGLTKANPGVATSAAHGLANGDVVVFSVSGGMVELDGQAVRVANVTANTFELEGLDTTDYSTWTSGDAYKVTAFHTMDSAQQFTMPNPAPAKLDTTTLLDKTKQSTYGLPESPDGQITGLFNPTGAAEAEIRVATKANTARVFRITWSSGLKAIFNANVSGGSGFDMQTNAVATATTSFTPKKDVLYYSS